jgi:hypothetical protein
VLAGVAIAVWALAQVPGAGALDGPALVLRVAAALVLASSIARAALRSVGRYAAALSP